MAALHGRWHESFALHAFGLPCAIVLLVWSILAIHQRRLIPWPKIPRSVVLGIGIVLLAYWLVRIAAHLHGLAAFPDG